MNKEEYHRIHEKLMEKMRKQVGFRNCREVERTGKRLYRLRRAYRRRFGA